MRGTTIGSSIITNGLYVFSDGKSVLFTALIILMLDRNRKLNLFTGSIGKKNIRGRIVAFDSTNSAGGIRKVGINIRRYSVWIKRVVDRDSAVTTKESLLVRFNGDFD